MDRVTDGRRRSLTSAQREMAADPVYVQYALALARRMRSRYPACPDLTSHALYGLLVAASTYASGSRATFKTWLYHKVRGAILDGVRDENQTRRRARYGTAFCELPPTLPAEDGSVGWELESVDAVEVMLKRLPLDLQCLARLYFLHGLTLKQVGKRLGYSESHVCQMLRRAVRFLREHLPASSCQGAV